jgi:hypothetical protein
MPAIQLRMYGKYGKTFVQQVQVPFFIIPFLSAGEFIMSIVPYASCILLSTTLLKSAWATWLLRHTYSHSTSLNIYCSGAC